MTFWKTLRWTATMGFLLLIFLGWLDSRRQGDSPLREVPPIRIAPSIVR